MEQARECRYVRFHGKVTLFDNMCKFSIGINNGMAFVTGSVPVLAQ